MLLETLLSASNLNSDFHIGFSVGLPFLFEFTVCPDMLVLCPFGLVVLLFLIDVFALAISRFIFLDFVPVVWLRMLLARFLCDFPGSSVGS